MLVPDSSLPKNWPRNVRSAFLHIVALAHRGVTYSRSWAADSPLVRVRLASRLEQAHNEIALLREEIRIKDACWAKIDARRRPHYSPSERFAILALRTARAWSAAQTSRAFLLEAETIGSWMRRIDEYGEKALVKLPTPINKFPDFVVEIVKQLRTLCPAMGKKRIAQHLAAASLAIGTTSVLRMLKRRLRTPPSEMPPVSSPANDNPQETPSQRTITAKRPNLCAAPEPPATLVLPKNLSREIFGYSQHSLTCYRYTSILVICKRNIYRQKDRPKSGSIIPLWHGH